MKLRGTRSRIGSNRMIIVAAPLALALGGAGCALAEDATGERESAGELAQEVLAPGDELFEITASPTSQTIGENGFAFVDLVVEPLNGFTGEVTLSVTSAPDFPGEVDLFSPVVTPPDSSFLELFGDCVTPPGDYALTITGTSEDGATATATATLTVLDSTFPPSAFFFFDRDGFTFQFEDFSSPGGCGGGADIVERAWDFGDGTTSSEENPVHTYAARGDFTVTLTVTNDEGLSDTETRVVTALPPPPVLSIFRITRDPSHFEFRVDLRWSGAEGDLVELHRNGFVVDLPDNDGVYRDRFRTLDTDLSWVVCELGLDFCSNEVSVHLGAGLDGDQATVTTRVGGQEVVETLLIEDESDQ